MDAVIIAIVAFALIFVAASLMGGKLGHSLILAAVIAIFSVLAQIWRRKRGKDQEG